MNRALKIGDKVWFRGQYAEHFTLRGTIEAVNDGYRPDHFGIRLENGTFRWATAAQIKPREH